jgi:uncharacterized protein with PIN domain
MPSPDTPSALEFARCSRCKRSLSVDSDAPSSSQAVKVGTNLYYCKRCASMVGYKT